MKEFILAGVRVTLSSENEEKEKGTVVCDGWWWEVETVNSYTIHGEFFNTFYKGGSEIIYVDKNR